MITSLIFLFLLVLTVFGFVQQRKFGRIPSGKRLERIMQSPNYRDGKFQNLSITPDLTEGVSYYTILKEFIFDKSKRSEPASTLPSQKVNLLTLSPDKDMLVWFGHSSYFLQVDGKKILVDPVFSGSASPIKSTTRSYKGSDVYTTDDLPEIDYLFISHDHWDHLDYETIVKLKPKIKKVITGLGVGEHLEHWGYDESIIIEKDWNEEIVLENGFVVNTTPARHFSGRGFKRCSSIWMSYVLQTPSMKIYLGGDSGYDSHFKEIGDIHGPFDLAILECGQYHKNWKYIHMMPEEVVQASLDLKAEKLLPVHWSKFTLAQHAWDDPIIRVTKEGKRENVSMLHPQIGEAVSLKDDVLSRPWWQTVH